MINLETIPKAQQKDFIASFWTMLQEIESKADADKDAVLYVWVEGWYRQWNRVTGDNKQPIWMRR